MFPRFLLRMSEDALRHPTEEVPQVQLCVRSQRLPPHLHHLSHSGRRRKRGMTTENSRQNQRREINRKVIKELEIYSKRQTFLGSQMSVSPVFNLFGRTCFNPSWLFFFIKLVTKQKSPFQTLNARHPVSQTRVIVNAPNGFTVTQRATVRSTLP